MLGEENKHFCIYSSQMVSQLWIKSVIWTICIYRKPENILHVHAEKATSGKNRYTTSSECGSMCSVKTDNHYFTGVTLR